MRVFIIPILLLFTTTKVNAQIKESTDLWNLLKIWDPLVPIPWTSQDIGLTQYCSVRMVQYAFGLSQRQAWANRMLDSTGRSASKFLFGSEFWLGSRVECEELGRESAILEAIRARNSTFDAVSSFQPHPPRTAYRRINLLFNLSTPLTPQPRKVSFGLCLPYECGSNADVQRIMELMIQATSPQGEGSFRDVKILKVRALPGAYSMWSDTAFILLLIACVILGGMTIIGTSLDLIALYSVKNESLESSITKLDKIECNGNHLTYTAEGPEDGEKIKGKASHSCRVHVEKPAPTFMWQDVFLSFSLRQNVRRFFTSKGTSSQEGSLSTVHGLRVFSLLWVIACHTCLYAFAFSDNKLFRTTVEKDFLFQSISNGNFSVDTFFFVSGMLIAYVFLRHEFRSSTRKESVAASGIKFIGFFVYRFIRLTPPYLFVLAVVTVSMRMSESNSIFDPPTWDHVTCGKYWWRNILYINTLFPVQEMCMIWSWYLAADTQFYVVGTLLLLTFARRPRIAVTLGLILLVSSWVITGAISLSLDHTPSIEKPFDMFDVLYDKPWTRFGPYLVGMGTGWILASTGGNIKMSKIAVAAGWTVSISVTFGLVHALYGRLLGPIASAAYVALSHTLWAITISWILLACTAGHGGWVTKILSSRLLIPFSRSTYCAYLVHCAVIQWAFFNMDSPFVMNRDLVVILILGFMMSSFLLGIVISIAFEAPVTRLLGLMHPLKPRQDSVSTSSCGCEATAVQTQ